MTNQFNRLCCPMCGEIDAVRKVSAIYSDGTQTGDFSGYYYGSVSGKNLGWTSGSVRMNGVSQTHLSQRLTPPTKPQLDKRPMILSIVGSLIPGIGILILYPALIWFIFTIISWLINRKRLWSEWERQMNAWSRQYYCHRCDIVIDPAV